MQDFIYWLPIYQSIANNCKLTHFFGDLSTAPYGRSAKYVYAYTGIYLVNIQWHTKKVYDISYISQLQ